MTEGVPLIIPEVNADAMKGMRYGHGGIIANPNCSTIIALMAVTPLHRAAKVWHIPNLTCCKVHICAELGYYLLPQHEIQVLLGCRP